jgi:hypothetical protein
VRTDSGEQRTASVTRDAALVDALHARKGVVCMVGAGGKKSTMYRLAQAHDGRVAVTTTVHIPPFPEWLDAAPVVADAGALAAMVLAQARHRSRLAYATRTDKPGRFGGVAAQTVAQLHEQAQFDVTLVKADGARRRQIKGPGGREPIVPEQAATVVAAVSAQIVGQPLDQRIAHYAYLEGDWLPDGAHLVPLINMAEDRESRRAAQEIAATLLDLSPRVTRVVISHMQGDDPLVAVVQR